MRRLFGVCLGTNARSQGRTKKERSKFVRVTTSTKRAPLEVDRARTTSPRECSGGLSRRRVDRHLDVFALLVGFRASDEQRNAACMASDVLDAQRGQFRASHAAPNPTSRRARSRMPKMSGGSAEIISLRSNGLSADLPFGRVPRRTRMPARTSLTAGSFVGKVNRAAR
jgi:hypothetical protein